jgi:ATP/maltotriose-dependent transcriptional regulator MalT
MQAPEAVQTPAATQVPGQGLVQARGLARSGQVAAALALVEDLRALGGSDDTDTALLLAVALDCRLARGDLAEALTLGDELAAYVDRPGLAGAVAHHARAEVASVLVEPETALEHHEAAGHLLADEPDEPELVPWRAGAALALLRLGRRREAAVRAREHLEAAVAAMSPYAVAQALRTLATTDASGDRTVFLRQARTTLAGVPARRLAAQVDTDLAGLLLLDGPRHADEALRLLRSVEEYAGRHELWPLQSRARRLLERLGEDPRRVHSEALAALTASERRIALLAAEGLTNRQIAHQLVVTVKAVEWHLSHVYRKLGIASRTRLAATLGHRPQPA